MTFSYSGRYLAYFGDQFVVIPDQVADHLMHWNQDAKPFPALHGDGTEVMVRLDRGNVVELPLGTGDIVVVQVKTE